METTSPLQAPTELKIRATLTPSYTQDALRDTQSNTLRIYRGVSATLIMNVLSALNNVYANLEPQKQWKRAVDIVKEMNEADVALSWLRFSAQISCSDTAEAIIKHSQFKAIFDGVVRDAMLEKQTYVESESHGGGHAGAINGLLDKYNRVVENQIVRLVEIGILSGGEEANEHPLKAKTQITNTAGSNAARISGSKNDENAHHGLVKRINDIEEKLDKIIESGAKLDAIEETLKNINTVATSTTGILEKVEDVLNKDIKMIQIKLTKQEYDRAMEDSRLDTLLTKCGELSDHIKMLDTSISTNKVDMIRECDGKFLALNQKIDSNLSALTAEIKDQCGLLSTQLNDLDEKLENRDETLTGAVNKCAESVASVNATMEKIPDMVSEATGTSVAGIIEEVGNMNDTLDEIYEYILADVDQLQAIHERLLALSKSTDEQISQGATDAIAMLSTKDSETSTDDIINTFAESVRNNFKQKLDPILEQTDYSSTDDEAYSSTDGVTEESNDIDTNKDSQVLDSEGDDSTENQPSFSETPTQQKLKKSDRSILRRQNPALRNSPYNAAVRPSKSTPNRRQSKAAKEKERLRQLERGFRPAGGPHPNDA